MVDKVIMVLVIGLAVFIGAVWLVYTYDILWRRAEPSSRNWLVGFLAVLAVIIALQIW